MDGGDRLLMAGACAAAACVISYAFWGPAGSSRLRHRRGQIAGLHNFGKTCFLNALLQALAACPQLIAWLQLHNTGDKKSLISSLQSVLEVVNGTHPSLRGDPYSPGAVIKALNNLGWMIPADEHDPHELLHVMLSSLEEELVKPKKLGCLSDALGELSIMPQPRPSSAMLSDFCNAEYGESTSFMRLARSEAHTPDSPHSTCNDDVDESLLDNTLLAESLQASPPSIISAFSGRPSRPRSIMGGNGMNGIAPNGVTANNGMNKRSSGSCRSLERLARGPGRVSIWSEQAKIQVPPPFRGGLSSQMLCSGCGHKSVVRYDKFDSITLTLSENKTQALSLGQLMSEFIAPETLNDVQCEACNNVESHTKTLTFGKLPSCLCIHISRTTWLPGGYAYKRQDFVHFPESLSMAPYSFIQPGLSSTANTPWGSTLSLYSSSLPNSAGGLGDGFSLGSYGIGGMFPRNLYRLLAVIVHSGDANSGHFITYRRGALRNSHRWYYTSDTVVKEVEIEEVLSCPAYILFYDRGGQQSKMANQ